MSELAVLHLTLGWLLTATGDLAPSSPGGGCAKVETEKE